MSQFNRQNSNQWMNNFAPQMRPKMMGVGGVRCGTGKGLRHNPMMRPDPINQPPSGPMMGGGMNMPQRLPMWNQQVCFYLNAFSLFFPPYSIYSKVSKNHLNMRINFFPRVI